MKNAKLVIPERSVPAFLIIVSIADSISSRASPAEAQSLFQNILKEPRFITKKGSPDLASNFDILAEIHEADPFIENVTFIGDSQTLVNPDISARFPISPCRLSYNDRINKRAIDINPRLNPETIHSQ